MIEKHIKNNPYSEKIWLKSYDDYVKPEIDYEVISLADMMKKAVKEFPDKLFYEFQGLTATYKEMEEYINSFASFLVENGIKKGDRIAIHLPNSPQYLIALYGTFYTGCTSVGMNFLLKPNEIVYQLKDSGASVLLTLDSFYEENVRKALVTGKTDVKVVIITNIADMFPKFKQILAKALKIVPKGKIERIEGIKYFTFKKILKHYPNNKSPDINIDPKNDVAFLQYTGGTTGPPKGAILTHENEVINIQQVISWLEVDLKKGSEKVISAFPMFHLAGMFFNLLAVYTANTQLLIANPRDIKHIFKLIQKWKPTMVLNVPTLYLMLLNDPKFKELDLSSIKVYGSGAAPFPSESIKQFEEVVGTHKLLEVYGMTEASPIVTMNPYLGTRKLGTVGIPVSNTDLKIVDVIDRNKEVPLGEAGEIVIKGPQIFKGYWNKPEETKNALKEGCFYSGDVGVMDEDGYITIVDRTKDMINVSGFKVFSVEVDDKMNKHPAIELCSTIGVPDPNRPGSEIVKLYILLKEGYKASEEIKEDILKFAQENLATYKVPKIIEILEEMPLTSVGKVDKKILRRM
jgi:long-chain acyl-CoA synthetase